MDAPVDFTLDRARLLGSNLTSSSLGTYEGAYVDSGHASALSRSVGLSGSHASLQDLARVGTPSSMSTLGQYQSRYIHPSIPIPSSGASYAMMGNFLNGSGSSGDHLKSLIPADLQQYWSAHNDGCGTRYIINNNNIYSPYLSYLPATESLSLFAHNVSAGASAQGHGQTAYHRIYDLHKEALYNVAPLGTSSSSLYGTLPPSRISPTSSRNASDIIIQSEKASNKKDNNRYDGKKTIDLSKSSSKTSESHSKNVELQAKYSPLTRQSKDADKKEEHGDILPKTSNIKHPKDSLKKEETKKQEKSSKSKDGEEKKNEEKKTNKSGVKDDKKVKKVNGSSSPELKAIETNSNDKKILKDDVKSERTAIELNKTTDAETKSSKDIVVSESGLDTKVQNIPTLTTVTLTPSESVTSIQSSNNPISSGSSPVRSPVEGGSAELMTGIPTMGIAHTSTTFSLPYYHSIYSHSQPPGAMDGKKVHAPTYTPEIGTLPSVASITSLPVQTTACDMRIKKENSSYSCCKEKNASSIMSNNSHSLKYSHCSSKVTSPKLDNVNNKTHCTGKEINVISELKEQKMRRGHSKEDKISEKLDEVKEASFHTSKTIMIPSSVLSDNKFREQNNRIGVSDSIVSSVKSSCISPREKLKLCSSVKSPLLEATSSSAFTAVNKSLSVVESSISSNRVSIVTGNASGKERSSNIGDRDPANQISPTDKLSDHPAARNSNRDSNNYVSHLKSKDTLLTSCHENKTTNRKTESRTAKLRTVQIVDSNGCRKSKLSSLVSGKTSDISAREKNGNHEDVGNTGMNIPVGIAVAQKREELKKESTDVSDNAVSGETSNRQSADSQTGTNQHGDLQQNGSSKSSSPQDSVSEMRNQLPANLIVTGSATGAGVAWADDPSARHFANPWIQQGHAINPPSWMGQMSYTLPTIPTSTVDGNQLPVSIPPGYKLVQDSVTGQFMMIPSSIDLYDPGRIWQGFPTTGHPGTVQQLLAAHQAQMQHHVIAQAQERQPTTDFAIAVQHYQQQLQHMYQARQDAVLACQDLSQGASGNVSGQTSSSQSSSDSVNHKEIQSPQTHDDLPISGQQNKEKIVSVHPQQSIPDIARGSPALLPDIVTIKTESSVQSRGTSPMVPASEIEDATQETIEASSSESITDSDSPSKNSNVNIASVQTCASERCNSSVSASSADNESVDNVRDSNVEKKLCSEIKQVEETKDKDGKSIDDKTGIINDKSENAENECYKNNDDIETEIGNSEHLLERTCNSSEGVDNSVGEQTIENKPELETNEKLYNPFLDPQILQAADGLELLSALAEKRSKCVDVCTFSSTRETTWTQNNSTENTENVCMFSETQPKSKRKQSVSRTRSVHIVKPDAKSDTPSYYTSTGLPIPQGEEEINAIELDMRIRLAELQRQYKEKQREFARLTPKRDKEDYNSKRGPGRPRKRNHSSSSPKNETIVKQGPQVKVKEPPVKKKKQAEELVDRVFRKTGGGFGMPLSKKLKASAMAALYKTQSGFTMKRKGSTSSSSSMSPLSTPVKYSSIIKKEKLNFKSQDGKGKLKVMKKLEDKKPKKVSRDSDSVEDQDQKDVTKSGKLTKSVKKTKEKEKGNEESSGNSSQILKKSIEKEDKSNDSDSGLGMLAKYAMNALNEHIASAKKATKRKVEEGLCIEQSKNNTEMSNNLASNTKPKDSDTETSSDGTSPSNKKRKPGRPRKCIPNKTHGVTETIVAKNSKNFRLYQLQKFEDMWNAGVSQPKPQLEDKSPMKPIFLDEEWMLRRSERIFLSDPSPQPSPNFSYKETLKPSPTTSSPQKQTPIKTKSEKAKLQKAKNIHDLSQRVKKKYSKAFKSKHQSKDKNEKKQIRHIPKKRVKKPISKEIISDSDSSSDGDNIPLSALRDRPLTPAPRSCMIDKDELKDALRVLLFKDGLFYEGAVQGIRPPDVYGVIIDNARGNRPLIYSQEEILKDAIIDVKASSSRFLPEGTRVCAYWSQQFSCLYPGTISKASPNPHADKSFVNVEFDDGDSGKIPLDHIRMIPQDFPIVSYDPNPLLLIGKRRRHTTSDSIQSFTTESHRSESSHPSESKPKAKRGPGRPPKQKSENGHQNSESIMSLDDDEDIDVCGLEDDHDEVFTSTVSTDKIRNESSKTLKHSKDIVKKKKTENNDRKSGNNSKIKEKKTKAKDGESGKSSKKKERGKHKYITQRERVGETSDIFSFKRLPSLSDKLFTSSFKRKTLTEQICNGSDICDTSTEQLSSAVNSSDDESIQDCSSVRSVQSLSSVARKQNGRSLSAESKSKIAAFLPARQLWRWSGKSTKRPGLKGKAKKEFYKSIIRGKEIIALGDCAVFLSTGRPHLPFIGRIISLWEAWGGQMVVKVKWFYHPEETRGGKKLHDMKGALFQSPHIDENDVQTISHKCNVLSFTEYKKRHLEEKRRGEHKTVDDADIYYLAGTYEPTIGLLKFEEDII